MDTSSSRSSFAVWRVFLFGRYLIIGAGVVGVTTAYYLAQQGCSVTVVDRADSVAAGASQGNAAQLSYTFTDAMAKPEFVAKIPGLMAGMVLAGSDPVYAAIYQFVVLAMLFAGAFAGLAGSVQVTASEASARP